MNIFKKFIKPLCKTRKKDIHNFVIEKLSPWIVLKCLKEENYIINDTQAKLLATEILKQVLNKNAQKQFIHSLKYV